jgi:sulfur carrier protein ThiS
MGKIKLTFSPWIARKMGAQGSDQYVLEREIEEGTKIGDVLNELALDEPGFRKLVFNPEIGQVGDQIHVVLNGQLLTFTEAVETELHDGDLLFLITVFTGG